MWRDVGRVESQVKAEEMMVLTTGDISAVFQPLKLSTVVDDTVFYTTVLSILTSHCFPVCDYRFSTESVYIVPTFPIFCSHPLRAGMGAWFPPPPPHAAADVSLAETMWAPACYSVCFTFDRRELASDWDPISLGQTPSWNNYKNHLAAGVALRRTCQHTDGR